MIGTNQELAQLNRTLALLRPLIRRNPWLLSVVAAERLVAMLGQQPDPSGVAAKILRDDPNSADLCELLTSPIGQHALAALGFEFPQWRLAFQVLPIAADAICQERRWQQIGLRSV